MRNMTSLQLKIMKPNLQLSQSILVESGEVDLGCIYGHSSSIFTTFMLARSV